MVRQKLRGLKNKVTFSGGEKQLSLDEIPDEAVNQATQTLKAQDEELTKENIQKQANYLIEIQNSDEADNKIGFIKDREETSVSDKNIIAPRRMNEVSTFQDLGYLERADDYVRILTITEYPRFLTPGCLNALYTTNANIRVCQHITPRDIQTILKKLQRKLNRLGAKLAEKREKGKHDTQEEEEKQNTARRLIWDIISGKTKLFDQSVYIEIIASDKRELDNLTKNVVNHLAGQNIDTTVQEKLQTQAQDAVCPAAEDSLKGSRELMQETTLATQFPFVEPEIVNPDGILYGFDQGGKPVFIDPYSRSSFIEIITGVPGSGKSFAKMWEILLRYFQDPDFPVWVLDPQSNFSALANQIGGKVVHFGGETRVNPLDIQPTTIENIEDPYQDKVRFVQGMYRTHFGDDWNIEIDGLMERIIHLSYLKYGITPDRRTHHKTPPIIQDHIDIAEGLMKKKAPIDFIELEDGARENKREILQRIANIQERMTPKDAELARFIYNGLESFNRSGVNSNLNGRTNVDLSNSFVVFDMGMFADTRKAPLMMHVVLGLIYQRCSRSDHKDEVVIDEVHKLMKNPDALEFLGTWARHHRHSRTRLSLLTQTSGEFLVEKDDKNIRTEIYEQATMKRLFFHERVPEEVEEFHDLTTAEKNYITSARQGENSDSSQCLMDITGIGKIPVSIEVPEFEIRTVDEDKNAWSYLYEEGDVTPKQLKILADKKEAQKYNVPQKIYDHAWKKLYNDNEITREYLAERVQNDELEQYKIPKELLDNVGGAQALADD